MSSAPSSASKFSVIIRAIMVYKFDSLRRGVENPAAFFIDDKLNYDDKTQVNILNIAQEVSIYESIYSPVMRCDIAITDAIGLLNNFPIVGEEIIHIIYQDMDGGNNEWFFVIKNISNIVIQPQNKALSYLMECETIEILANDYKKVRKAYCLPPKDLAMMVWEDHILSRMDKVVSGWGRHTKYADKSQLNVDISDGGRFVFIIPNLYPLDAMNLVRDIIPADDENKTFLFYQNLRGFHLKSLQSLYTEDIKNIARAEENEYVFLSNEVPGYLENKHNIISELYINSRSNSRDRLKEGYFNSILFEINPHIKAINSDKAWYEFTKPSYINVNPFNMEIQSNKKLNFIEKYATNTDAFRAFADSAMENYNNSFSEEANKIDYFLSVYPEFDEYFSTKRFRERKAWDDLSFSALNSIELTVVIPGTIKYCVGDLFNIKLEEFHGFTDVKIDKALSGLYLITEVKHILYNSGFHSTTLRLNRDSYGEDINISPKYNRS